MTPVKIHEDDHIEVLVMDEPGSGGACHEYLIVCKNDNEKLGDASFQNGGIAKNGVNGITNEALIAILMHRLNGFQSGDFPCFENDIALHGLSIAGRILRSRTDERKQRGVEGKEQR